MTLARFMESTPRPTRFIAHVDMDAFYASVEERENPLLKGLPVVVGADPKGGRGRGVVTTASYAARKYGVRSAMPISLAYRLCPHAVFLRPRFEAYTETSARVFRILLAHAPVVEKASIDEAYLELTDAADTFEAAADVARRIQAAVREAEGLTCSIGLATGKTVAKIASDRDKPAGLTIVPPGTEAAFLANEPVGIIPGVGPRTAESLEAAGVATCADLARADPAWLASKLGTWGPRLGMLARGEDDAPVIAEWDRKSVGAESTFEEDEDDPDAIRRALDGVAQEAADGLAAEGRAARTVTIKVRVSDFTTFTRSRTLAEPVTDEAAIANVARDLLAENWPRAPVRLLGVRLTGLVRQPARQVGLDAWPVDVLGEDARAWEPPPSARRWF